MRAVLSHLIIGLALLVAAPQAVEAKSPKSPKIKIEDKRDKYKYEYDDGICKFKYEYKFKKGEVTYKEKGDCRAIARLPQFNPPVPFSAKSGKARRGAQLTDLSAFCNSADLGALLGAEVGASLGNGDRRDLVTLFGTAIGAALGYELGRSIDDDDRRCIGSALEYAEPGRNLTFSNRKRDYSYNLRPMDRFASDGRDCRRFELRFEGRGRQDGIACRNGAGSWDLVELR